MLEMGGGGQAAEGSGIYRHVVIINPCEAREKKFSLHFSAIKMGSRGTFVLCTDTPDVQDQ